MAGKEGYDVLRLIEHGKTCYISSEYVEGSILAEWIRSRPDVDKEQLFLLIREITNQLGMIHKCRKKPYYQYVNPYSIVVAEEGKPYFLDLEAGSNEKRLRFMQRRVVRECFLPKEEAYYQKGSTNLDIYGIGKTIQYLLAMAEPEPPLNRREERRFLRIISKCLNYQSRISYQSTADIRRSIPQYKKKSEHMLSIRRTILMAAGAALILAAAWRFKEAGDYKDRKTETGLSEVTENDMQKDTHQEGISRDDIGTEAKGTGSAVFGADWLLRGGGDAYMELAMAYILDLEDYEKSLYYLEKIREYAPAGDLIELAEALGGETKEEAALEESLIRLEDEAAKDSTGQYYRCLIRGYGLLDTERAAQAVLRLGRLCKGRMDSGDERWKEVGESMAVAYEKLARLYEAGGQTDEAIEACIQGIGELDGPERLEIMHIRLLLGDGAAGRDLCAKTIQEYIQQTPEILENEELKKLMEEYGIGLEGEQVWAGQ